MKFKGKRNTTKTKSLGGGILQSTGNSQKRLAGGVTKSTRSHGVKTSVSPGVARGTGFGNQKSYFRPANHVGEVCR